MKKLALLFMLGMLAGVVSAQTKVSPQQGGTGIDTSHSSGCPSISGGVWSIGGCGGGGGGSGTVTSIGITVPAAFTVSGSPITTSGAIGIDFATEPAFTLLGNFTSGTLKPVFVNPFGSTSETCTSAPAGVSIWRTSTGKLCLSNAGPGTADLAGHDSTGAYVTYSGGDIGLSGSVATVIGIRGQSVPVPAAGCLQWTGSVMAWGSCGSGSGVTIQTNGVNNTTQTLLNIQNSSANTIGLLWTASNPSGGITRGEITGTLALAAMTGGAPGAADAAYVSTSTSAAAWKSIGSCSGANQALTYNTSTHAFGCATISGAGGTPGGSNTQLQYNNSGSFGGDTATTDGSGNLTVTSITGSNTSVNGAYYTNRASSGDVLPSNPASNGVVYTVNGGKPCVLYPSGTCVIVPQLAGFSCQPGITNLGTAIPAGTYSGQFGCQNDTGQTITISAIKCRVDAGSSSTANVANNAGTGLLTGAITCGTSYTNGTLSGTTTIAAGDSFIVTYVLDGTATQIIVDIRASYPWS